MLHRYYTNAMRDAFFRQRGIKTQQHPKPRHETPGASSPLFFIPFQQFVAVAGMRLFCQWTIRSKLA
jgi:hypothetical protein